MDAIRTQNLQKNYGKTKVLQDITLSVAEGAFWGLIGKNGAGKSTLINTLTGTVLKSGGAFWIYDTPDCKLDYAKKSIGVMPDVSGLYGTMTGAEFLRYMAYKYRSRAACSMHSIKHERLEAAVLFAVRQQVHLAVSYSELVARINSAPIKKSQSFRLDDLIAAKERELTKITRYKQSLYQDWKDGEITQQDYRNMKADYERQAAALSDVLERLTAERAELANGVDNEHPALVAFMKYQNIETLNREILIELVDYIKVYENGNISVKFKFADELRKIAEYIEINISEIPAVAG